MRYQLAGNAYTLTALVAAYAADHYSGNTSALGLATIAETAGRCMTALQGEVQDYQSSPGVIRSTIGSIARQLGATCEEHPDGLYLVWERGGSRTRMVRVLEAVR